MTPYQQFVFDRSRKSNLIGLSVTIIMLVALFKIDSLVLPEDSVPLGSLIRFGVILPLLITSAVLCYRQQHINYAYVASLTVLVFVLWWYFALTALIPESIPALLTATIQVLFFSSLLLTLPIKFHLFSLIVTGLAAALTSYYSYSKHPQWTIVFALGCSGTIILLLHWVVLRERRYQSLYQAFLTLDTRLQARTIWNGYISSNIRNLNETKSLGIQKQVCQLVEADPQDRFLNRAHESIIEISCLMNRFASHNDWERFSAPDQSHFFSIQHHVLEVLAESQIKHPDMKFELNVSQDFECQIEKSLVTRLIVNLIENAIRAAKPGTPVLIEIDSNNVLSIENQGAPLSRPLSELAEPGNQGANPGQFGLGLYVCSKICKANGLGLTGKNTNRGVRIEIHFAPDEHIAKRALS